MTPAPLPTRRDATELGRARQGPASRRSSAIRDGTIQHDVTFSSMIICNVAWASNPPEGGMTTMPPVRNIGSIPDTPAVWNSGAIAIQQSSSLR